MPHEKKAQIQVSIGATGEIRLYREYDVVEAVEEKEEEKQLLLEDAQKLDENAEVG
jgi:hypothetical protein